MHSFLHWIGLGFVLLGVCNDSVVMGTGILNHGDGDGNDVTATTTTITKTHMRHNNKNKKNNLNPSMKNILQKVTATTNTSLCERIHPNELPTECSCSDDTTPYGFMIQCLKHFNGTHFNDTIGIQLVVDPCNPNGSSMSIDITEEDHHIEYPITGLKAGEEQYYPIPGLSIIIPGLGSVGVDVDVWIAGNPDLLLLKVGLNACTLVHDKFLCASSLPGLHTILPWWILSGTYTFGDICNSTTTTTTSTTTTLGRQDDDSSSNSNNVLATE